MADNNNVVMSENEVNATSEVNAKLIAGQVKVNFKVASAKGEAQTAVAFTVDFNGVSDDYIRRCAIQSRIISWQSQIRNNFDAFKKGELPKVVKFDNPLFASAKTVTRKPTEAEIKEAMKAKVLAMKESGASAEDILLAMLS